MSSRANPHSSVTARGWRDGASFRVEVSVSKDDASLVRQVAAALSDPARQGRCAHASPTTLCRTT